MRGALIQGFTVPVNVKRESPHSLGLVNSPVKPADSICHLQVKFLGEMVCYQSELNVNPCLEVNLSLIVTLFLTIQAFNNRLLRTVLVKYQPVLFLCKPDQ